MEEPKFDQAPIPESPNPEQNPQKIWPQDYTSEEIKERLRKRKPYEAMEFGIDSIPTSSEERNGSDQQTEEIQRRLRNQNSGSSINFGTDPIPEPEEPKPQRKFPDDYSQEELNKIAEANRKVFGPEPDYDNDPLVKSERERLQREEEEFEQRLEAANAQNAQHLELIRNDIAELPDSPDLSK